MKTNYKRPSFMKNAYKSWMNLEPIREEGLTELYSTQTTYRMC
jgi:hypothetical protein